jgi:hypothetical protein
MESSWLLSYWLFEANYVARFAGSIVFSTALPQLALWARRMSPAPLAEMFRVRPALRNRTLFVQHSKI